MKSRLEQLRKRIVSQGQGGLKETITLTNSMTDQIDRLICDINIRRIAVERLLKTLRGGEDVPLGLAADLWTRRSSL